MNLSYFDSFDGRSIIFGPAGDKLVPLFDFMYPFSCNKLQSVWQWCMGYGLSNEVFTFSWLDTLLLSGLSMRMGPSLCILALSLAVSNSGMLDDGLVQILQMTSDDIASSWSSTLLVSLPSI